MSSTKVHMPQGEHELNIGVTRAHTNSTTNFNKAGKINTAIKDVDAPEQNNTVPGYTPITNFCRSFWCEKIKLVCGSGVVFLLILVVFIGIVKGYCVLKIHVAANFVLLFMALLLLAYCEALHYGVVAMEKWDMSVYQERYPRACKVHKLVDTPVKVKKFLVGRQFFTIFVVFLISQITSFPGK